MDDDDAIRIANRLEDGVKIQGNERSEIDHLRLDALFRQPGSGLQSQCDHIGNCHDRDIFSPFS